MPGDVPRSAASPLPRSTARSTLIAVRGAAPFPGVRMRAHLAPPPSDEGSLQLLQRGGAGTQLLVRQAGQGRIGRVAHLVQIADGLVDVEQAGDHLTLLLPLLEVAVYRLAIARIIALRHRSEAHHAAVVH